MRLGVHLCRETLIRYPHPRVSGHCYGRTVNLTGISRLTGRLLLRPGKRYRPSVSVLEILRLFRVLIRPTYGYTHPSSLPSGERLESRLLP